MAKSAKSAALRAVPREASAPISAPSPRQGVLWSPALLRQVLRRADAGDMLLLADLCDQVMADDRFGALLGQLADDVLGCELTFEDSLRTSVGAAEKSEELEVDWEIGYEDDEIRSLIAWTLLAGVGFAKHEAWRESENGRVVPVLKWWHPQHFSWRQKDGAPYTGDQRNHSWHVRESGAERWVPIAAGDGTWVIVTKGGDWRPWANGLWRGLGAWWLLKEYAKQDMGVHSEKASKLVATSTVDSTADERKSLANYLYDAGKDAVIALPIGTDLKLIETTANVDQIYGAQIRMANESAAISILGQNLSTNVQEGSRAAAQVHDQKENRRVRNAAWMVAKPLKFQSLVWWSEFNFGTRDYACYPYWHTEPAEDYAAKAAGLKTLGEALAALKGAGYKLSPEEIEEEYGVVLEEHEEEPDPEDPDGGGAPVEDEEPAEDDAAADGADAVEDDPTSDASAAGVYLASGDDPDEAPGFVHGQLYVDALTARQTALAADQLSGFVDQITAAIDGADDYESMRYAVIKAFQAEADPDQLADIVHAGLVLANLSGRHSVLEDLPEDAEPSVDARQTELFPDLTAAVQHYPAGSSKGGQFMPKNGSAGSATKGQAKKAPGGAKKAAGGGGGTAAGAKPKVARKKAAAPKGAPEKKAAKKPAAKAKVAKKPATKRKAAKRKAGGDSSDKPAAAKPRKAAKKKAARNEATAADKPTATKKSAAKKKRDSDGAEEPVSSPVNQPQPSARLGTVGEQVFGRKLSDSEIDEIAGKNASLPKGHELQISVKESMNSVIFEGKVWNEEGFEIANLKREFTRHGDVTHVKHSHFDIDPGSQGQGIGKHVFNAQVDAYQKHGIGRVSLEAAEVGKYVWTKAGFEWDSSHATRVQNRLKRHLDKTYGHKTSWRVMKSVRTPEDISRLTIAGKRVGKEFLIDLKADGSAEHPWIPMSQTPAKIKRL